MTLRHVKVMRKGLDPSPFSYLYGVMINNMKNEEKKGCEFPFVEVLTLIFVAAKLFGYVDWGWMMVLSPIWISLLAEVCMAIVMVAVIWIMDYVANK